MLALLILVKTEELVPIKPVLTILQQVELVHVIPDFQVILARQISTIVLQILAKTDLNVLMESTTMFATAVKVAYGKVKIVIPTLFVRADVVDMVVAPVRNVLVTVKQRIMSNFNGVEIDVSIEIIAVLIRARLNLLVPVRRAVILVAAS